MRVAIVGATGAVGSAMLDVMATRGLPADEVVPFASPRSTGRTVAHAGNPLEVRPLAEDALDGFDIALFSAGGSVSEEWAPRFRDAGALVIDNSSFWRMDADVPLVVAEVNPEAIDSHKGIVANPNCSTCLLYTSPSPRDS